MRQVRHLLDEKGRTVHSVRPDETVFAALQRMAEHGIGSLAVVDDNGLVGVMSERDYARKVILMRRYSTDTPVADVMTAEIITVTPDERVDECMQLCTKHHVRHLPVLENRQLVGLVSIGDLVKAMLDEQAEEIAHLQNYISG